MTLADDLRAARATMRDDDADETVGRALYRLRGDALARAQVNYSRRRVKLCKPRDRAIAKAEGQNG